MISVERTNFPANNKNFQRTLKKQKKRSAYKNFFAKCEQSLIRLEPPLLCSVEKVYSKLNRTTNGRLYIARHNHVRVFVKA